MSSFGFIILSISSFSMNMSKGVQVNAQQERISIFFAK